MNFLKKIKRYIFGESLTINQEELKRLAKYISEHSSIETISAKNLKVESLENRKDKE
ncbi:hypothetical protein [uncultured Gemella sp.]|uniref:hypothetical protein n=1 Tax=uncultured Gemella sp. TaxID=254352 RepID=UPI0028D1E9E0|nr:hypothetical protein [uncultured Gemella sp.]